MLGRSGSVARTQNASSISRSSGSSATAAIMPSAPVKNYQTTDDGIGGALVEGEWSSLNPSLYQNMSNDQVDWAALAQQWIQMKETLPASMVPAAPPPPIISSSYVSNTRESFSDCMHSGTIEEQGEAPMEVERDEENLSAVAQHQSQIWDNSASNWQYSTGSEWRNPTWQTNWSEELPSVNDAAGKSSFDTVTVNPSASIAVANWQAKMARIYKIGESNNSDEIASPTQPMGNQRVHQQHPLPPQQSIAAKRIPGLMDQVIKLDQSQADQEDSAEVAQGLNDAKRKLLPAWIREGLEKMEREKQRQEEKEKEQRLREEMLEQRRQAELEALTELENARKRSKFDSDSEEEESENVDKHEENQNNESSPLLHRSREEVLQELMVAVRRNLTEILLEVTNEEIASIAKETVAKTRRKAQALRKTGLASLTGGLGLGIYGDSDEDDESGSDQERNEFNGSDDDDEETDRNLRNIIKQRQKEFERTAREIEEQLAQDEAREERRRREYEQATSKQEPQQVVHSDEEDNATVGGSRAGLGHSQPLSQSASGPATGKVHGGKFGPRDGETQPVNDKLYAYKLGRSRDKRISRFSDPKDTVRQTHITHVAIVNHKPGEVIATMPAAKATAPVQSANVSGTTPSVASTTAVPLFPAAIAAAMHLEQYRRENSVTSETPSNASGSRASSSHRSVRDGSSSKSTHKSHKSKKHKRSRYSRSDDEEDYYDNGDYEDDRFSQHSRRSHSSERSGHSRRRRSYSRDSRDDGRNRKYSYRSRDRSRSRDRYRSSRRSRSRSRSSSRRRH
ncbi:arginine/serine-rich protein PNISR-like isoform X2 [Wyeomyia smithii]|uniref:arginine/serine-rich protein PNISR-like isoform X2 n=1 Tax=Wyeomyia smithii TaxID=174621 RepID=UPI002467F76B|nr:arginine/serine-rich protein PNISR-like isoform X2 [Wyeomyia smithii]